MATEKAKKQGLMDKFMHAYESYKGKRIVGIVYSAGASVVIIGALFKILHLKFASEMLFAGMMTEALLFAIGCFDKPHPEFHWENVFPQLLGYGTDPDILEEKSKQARPSLLGAGVEGEETNNGLPRPVTTSQPTNAAPTSASVPSLSDGDMQSLKDGIAELAKTANQFAELGKVAQSGVKLGEKLAAAETATEAYASKLTAAGAATESYTSATATLAQSYAQVTSDMQNVADETKAYKQSVLNMGQKLASLTSVYELQLQAVNAQMEAQKSAATAAKEASEAQIAFANGTKQLQKQVADLNAIYGNMLNALA